MMHFKNLEKLKRTRQIIGVLTKYGLGYLIDRQRRSISSTGNKGKSTLNAPEKLCRALEELGPTFVKFGQILSTRPDFLPPEFIKELERLQDNTPPFEASAAQQIIEKELGKSSYGIFRDFDPVPVAAASLSQVHKAILPNGDKVAVKIRRPGIRQIIDTDLAILEDLAQFAENRLHNGWIYRPRLMVEEYRKSIRKELDFAREAQNFEKFRMNFRDVEHIRVPKVYWELTTSAVLTMEFIDGIKINETAQEKYRDVYDPHKIAIRGAEAIMKQILEDGFFHADPHPANLFVMPPADIIMLDVGMTGYLDKNTRFYGAKLLQALVNRDAESTLNRFEDLKIIIRDVDRGLLRQELAELFDSYLGIPLGSLDISKAGQEVIGIMIRHNLTLPPNLVLMIKALSMIESTGKELYPDLDMLEIARPFVRKISIKRLDPGEILKRSSTMIQESAELIERLPEDMNIILNKVREGKLKFVFELHEADKLRRSIASAGHQISLSILIAAIIIGSSVIFALQANGPLILGYPAFGVAGFSLALILILLYLWSVIKKR
ncbi:MAG: hypothetical protein GYA41_07590 [Bacteroidales bacterium]|nr:hypothetical protein [Bacteroidales bacterium]